MLTRCPHPSCQYSFDHSSQCGATGKCPQCGQPATFKPLEILEKIDIAYARRRQQAMDSEGPQWQETPVRFSAIVEDVRSLWNVGSIFRTADGAGFSKLYLCGITGCPPRKEITKTSLGAEQTVSWQYCRNLLEIIPDLKNAGVKIVGLESTTGSVPLSQALEQGALHAPLSLVVGNEVTGLSAEALSVCDLVCHLPMRGQKESLNVAVAFGIAAYLLTEKLSARTNHLGIKTSCL